MKRFICFFIASCLASFLVACELTRSGGGGGKDSSSAVRTSTSGVLGISGNLVILNDGWTLIINGSVPRQRGSCSGSEPQSVSSILYTDYIKYKIPLNSEDTDVANRTGVPSVVVVYAEECLEFIKQDLPCGGCMQCDLCTE